MFVTAYIGLGSNLGDRQQNVQRALEALQGHPAITVTRVSSLLETKAVGGPPGQPDYINAVAEILTDLEPDELLLNLLEVEQNLGRVRRERHGPRTIDLDLLLYGDLVREAPGLTLPHPRMHERMFVLRPLAELAPELIHPVRKVSIRQLLEQITTEPAPTPAIAALESFLEPPQELPSPTLESFLEPPQEVPSPALESFLQPAPELASPALESFLKPAAEIPLPIPESVPDIPQEVPPPAPVELPAPVSASGELAGLRAVVTGSTSGIGRAIALELAAGGADVIVHGRRPAAAEDVAALLRDKHVEARVLLGDLRDPEQLSRFAEAAWAEWDGLDIWINNAGADTLTGEAADWPFERKLQELLDVDVKATIALARTIGRRMQERGQGVMLNVGWDQADTGMEGDSGQLFAAAKAAVMAFSKSLARTLAPQVRVNCLAPGWIRTAWGESASQSWQERVQRETLLRRWGTPQDVAAAARWLVSPAAAYITGQVIRINGGH
jgi:3-oxoacyl-[acyl-carrier protein] reductase